MTKCLSVAIGFFALFCLCVATLIQAKASAAAEKTPLHSFDMQVPVPPTPLTVADSQELVYELHVSNFSQSPVVVDDVEVLNAAEGTLIKQFSGNALAQIVELMGEPSVGTRPLMIAPGGRGVVFLDLDLDGMQVPKALEHRVTFHLAGKVPRQSTTVSGARITVRTESPVVLGPPLCGGPWIAVYNPSWKRGHRRVFYPAGNGAGAAESIPGRYAIDWIKVDRDGHVARGDNDTVSNWYGYGADVLAVADGVVAGMRADLPESATLSGANPKTDAGNYIALDIGNGRYAFYEHLKPGSLRVALGERVKRGQVIASLGFTGHSTGPHLHFHIANAKYPSGAEGLPYEFENLKVLGVYKDFDRFGKAPWTSYDHQVVRARALPAPFAAVGFGACKSPE